MVYVYKVLLSESVADANTKQDKRSIQNRTSGMIDYQSFLKSLIRISVIAQEKLGGAKEDLLKQKMDKDTANNKVVADEKQIAIQKNKEKEKKSKEEMAKLKQ